jgi:hypothetical protein
VNEKVWRKRDHIMRKSLQVSWKPRLDPNNDARVYSMPEWELRHGDVRNSLTWTEDQTHLTADDLGELFRKVVNSEDY